MSSPVVRVLLVDDDEDEFVLTRDLLAEADAKGYTLDWASTYDAAAQAIRDNRYDVYLIDYRLGQSSGLDLLRRELDEGRRRPAILLTGQGTREVDEEAMQAGAADYLVKGELRPSDLEKSIRYAVQRHRADHLTSEPTADTARVLSLIGAKGGVGTTTVAANLAIALARRGAETAAVDMRPYLGMLARYLNVAGTVDLRELLRTPPADIDSATLRKFTARHPSGLRVLPGPQTVGREREISVDHARAILDGMSTKGGYVVVDIPTQPSEATRLCVERSDFVGLVVEREPCAIESARWMLDLLDTWRVRPKVGAILVDRADLATPPPVSGVAATLNCRIFAMVPASTDAFTEAAARGAPVVMSLPDHPASQALAELAGRLTMPQPRALAV